MSSNDREEKREKKHVENDFSTLNINAANIKIGTFFSVCVCVCVVAFNFFFRLREPKKNLFNERNGESEKKIVRWSINDSSHHFRSDVIVVHCRLRCCIRFHMIHVTEQ